jgi:hypothetical protein
MSKERLNEVSLKVELFNTDTLMQGEVDVVVGSDDKHAVFIENMGKKFERDLMRIENPYWGKSHRRRRPRREMGEIKDRFLKSEDMREFLGVLSGKITDKRIQLLVAEDGEVLGYNLKGISSEE